jgi:hypothetical protein
MVDIGESIALVELVDHFDVAASVVKMSQDQIEDVSLQVTRLPDAGENILFREREIASTYCDSKRPWTLGSRVYPFGFSPCQPS